IIIASGGEEQSVPAATQSQVNNVQQETQVKELTPEQKEVKSFLTEIGILTIKSGKGTDDVGKAGVELQSNGLPLPYIISSQLILESVLEEAKKIKVPSGGESVKNYFIESVQYQLSGVKTIREGLEEGPINEKKLWQGLEILNKGMLPLARSTEEINKLKAKVGLQ
ncbi:hypothetical protein KKA96_04415, partial [Patescibacteria group bacterium]|nr:hypothetical protein [Patescibacteria group bacterium]